MDKILVDASLFVNDELSTDVSVLVGSESWETVALVDKELDSVSLVINEDESSSFVSAVLADKEVLVTESVVSIELTVDASVPATDEKQVFKFELQEDVKAQPH